VHEYATGLTSPPKDELICKCRNFTRQDKVKIFKV